MALFLKPKHLPRYRDIARLLLKYGRGDLLHDSEFDSLTVEDQAVGVGAASSSAGRSFHVHERPGSSPPESLH